METIVGQLVYNLDDYDNTGGTVSTITKDQLYKNFFDGVWSNYQIKKIGIQAPPGTKIRISTNAGASTAQEIMIGRNGIYELEDEFVRIKYFCFIRQPKWVYDAEATDTKKVNGEEALNRAKEDFIKKLNELDKTAEDYWIDYDKAFNEYIIEYEEAYSIYMQGINGVYKNIDTGKTDDNGNPIYESIDPKNIIIDYVAEILTSGGAE